ncbi:hypothetical protein [Leptospira sarikeiensis]|uniref:hypothetical protein n=1 Tax=Leptospira sarikeiensis TaxID=2484943 RepID=UPI001FEA9459|nr:hypothetical protein [Leptospira sarikeiensis]
MNSALGFAVLLGAFFSWILFLGILFKPQKSSSQFILAFMLFLLGIWQGQTAFSLLELKKEILAPYSLLNLPAAYAFLPLFYLYGKKLLEPEIRIRKEPYLSIFLFIFVSIL